MDQLNQVAQNMVNILSDWKDENDKYKASIDKFQAGLDVQAAALQNFINSNLATQSNATKNVEKASGKRPLPQSSNGSASPAKRVKNNDGEPVASPSASTANNNTNSKVVATAKRNPKPFVMISPLAIKKEKNDMMFVVDSRTVGKVTVSSSTGEMKKNPLDASVTLPRGTARIVRQKSKAPGQPLAILVTKKAAKLASQASSTSTSSQASDARPSTNKENDSFAQGSPTISMATSTPIVASVAKKTTATAVASKPNKAPAKAMKPSAAQNVGRIMTRRASKM